MRSGDRRSPRRSTNSVPLYLVRIREGEDASFERPASYASTRALVPGEEIEIEREFFVIERVSATLEEGYDALLTVTPTGRRRRIAIPKANSD